MPSYHFGHAQTGIQAEFTDYMWGKPFYCHCYEELQI